MVDQRTIKTFLKDHSGTYFSVADLAKVLNENIRSIYSKMVHIKSDSDIAIKQLNVGGQVGVITLYSHQDWNNRFGASMKEYSEIRNNPHTRSFHTETVESILIMSKLDEIIELLKGVIENGKKD